MKLSSLALLGALLGAVAAFAQIRWLPWGALGVDQLAPFFAFHLGIGATLLLVLCGLVRTVGVPVKRTPWAAGLVLALLFAGLFVVNRRPLPPVFLVVSDTTRARSLSLHGAERPTTPFLEELARRSVVFDDAVSQGSHTIVTTPALLASCYPSEHGLNDYQDVLSDDHVLVSEALESAGYYTFGVVTNPHLSPRNGFDQGYAIYELHGRGNRSAVFAETLRPRIERKLDLHRPIWEEEQGREGAPVFGFLFYTDPHSPYRTPREWPRRFVDPDTPDSLLRFEWSEERSEEERDALLEQYDACLAYWDSEFRELSALLAERDLWNDALVIYTSDHGEEFLEHGGIAHGSTLYEEVVHVPLLISLPVPVRFPPLPRTTRRVAATASSVDVMPTVLDYLRLPPLLDARGTSLRGEALGYSRGDPERKVILEEILEHYEVHELQAVRTSTHKYVRILRTSGEAPEEPEQLFDLREDPGETENLLDEEPELAERLRTTLDEHALRVSREDHPEPGRMVADEEHRARLRALGYLD